MVRGRLGASSQWVHRSSVAVHDIFVEGVLEIPRCLHIIEALLVGLVLAEQKLMLRLRIQLVHAERSMLSQDGPVSLRNQRRLFARFGPRPGVTKPELREYMDRRLL